MLAGGSTVAGQLGGVDGIGREPAAHVHLAAGAAHHLLVGGEHDDAVVRQHVDLHARGREPRAGDELLDDAAVGQVFEVPLRQRLEPGAQVAGRAQVDHLVAVARPAVVVLDHDARHVWPSRPQRRDGREDVVDRAHVLATERPPAPRPP